MTPNFPAMVKHFAFEGDFIEAQPCGDGHINDTYAVLFRTADGAAHRYVMQRINHHVFKEPEKLMANMVAVTEHLRRKVIAAGGDVDRETINLVRAEGGRFLHRTDEGDYWRAYRFIENARSYQIAETPRQLYNAGKAFGRFLCQLADYPVETLHETITDFHHTAKRYAAFAEAVRTDVKGRGRSVAREIAFVEARAEETGILVDLLAEGRLPLRVTHNDTKLNNILIDDLTGEGICVIDLDTVMPGLALYDFGDAIRAGAMPAAEDERDLSKVGLDLELFEHYTRGYLEAAGGFLTAREIDLLPFAAKLITFEQGMRFLTDYLRGDPYYKIQREHHNLDRARTQFKMVADMEAKFGEMGGIVARYAAGGSG
ncbi:MAG: phosphotransferase enzyme family protein [Bacteroidota bacterium]